MGAFRDGEEPFRSSPLAPTPSGRRRRASGGTATRGGETVVLDDFKDYAMPPGRLQRLLDWYPLWVEVKGGSVPMMAKRYV